MLLVILACVDPTAVDSGKTGVSDSGDTGEPSPAEWAPLVWTDCEELLDVGTLPRLDESQVFRPAVLGDRAWYAMRGVDTPQSIALATLSDATTWTDIDVYLQGHDLGTLDVSSPAPVERPDGGVALFFDAREEGLGLGLWRCDLDDQGAPETCASVLRQGTHGTLDSGSAQIPFVHVDEEGTWRLWYTGLDNSRARRILASISSDGWSWETPMLSLDLGTAGSWDDTSLYAPFVWRDATGWRMLYAGRTRFGEEHLVKRLIEARSDDGVSWTDATMVLDLGCEGSWDAWRLDSPWVVPEGSGYRLYYDGFDDPLTEVGIRRILTATSGVDTPTE